MAADEGHSSWDEEEFSDVGSDFEVIEPDGQRAAEEGFEGFITLERPAEAGFESLDVDLAKTLATGTIQRVVRRRARSRSRSNTRSRGDSAAPPVKAIKNDVDDTARSPKSGPRTEEPQLPPFVLVSVLEEQATSIQRAVRTRLKERAAKEEEISRIQAAARASVNRFCDTSPTTSGGASARNVSCHIGGGEELGRGPILHKDVRQKWSLFRHRRRLEKENLTSSTRTPPATLPVEVQ